MSKGLDVDSLIHYWESKYSQCQFLLDVSTNVIIKDTIEALKWLKVKSLNQS